MKTIKAIALEVDKQGGELWVIGGTVREMLYRKHHPHFIHASKDVDAEIYGISPAVFESIITQFGEVDFVGQQFGVYKLTTPNGEQFDFNFPRSDSVGRRPEVEIDQEMSKALACSRRNFVCNMGMWNPLSGEWADFYGAEDDIRDKRLDILSEEKFAEDPLRPLIGLFLCGAYDMRPTMALMKAGQGMTYVYKTLPPPRIWEEWKKWATRSIRPSRGLNYLKAIGWLYFYPELDILDTIPQDPEWHPEGNVWIHTLLACDDVAYTCREWDAEDRLVVMLAALCHDLDKALFTSEEMKDGKLRIVSPGHDEGIRSDSFLSHIHCPNDIKERVLALVRTHMVHIQGMKPKKLLKRLGQNKPIHWLALVSADHSARPPLPDGTPAEATKLFHEMVNQPPDAIEPIVTGKHLMALGVKPGPEMGVVLKNIYELGQLDNEFDTLEAGIRWAYDKGFINWPYDAEGNIKPEVLNAKRNK